MSPILQTLANGSAYGYRTLAGAAAGPAFESIASASGTGSSDTITFSSIPSTYQYLQIRMVGKGTSTGSAGTNDAFLTFNNDTGTNYVYHALYGDGSSAGVDAATSQSSIRISRVVASSNAANNNIRGFSIFDIHDYASTTKNKTVRNISGTDTNGVASSEMWLTSGLWINTSAINSITIKSTGTGSWATSTVISLYGIKA